MVISIIGAPSQNFLVGQCLGEDEASAPSSSAVSAREVPKGVGSQLPVLHAKLYNSVPFPIICILFLSLPAISLNFACKYVR